ncbi:Transmembrane protein 62 [Eumeta japonica]|uniref:Transmembrane protein 62 n=1 Tax=Eumeta variegata TaxID=151549 RepID=A0A4C1ZJM8_EUMVA|nr:Transmembrane protein 62 [Eumeta japonica]
MMEPEGDLTDAKAKDNLGSSQVKTEWVYYYNIIKESGVTDNVTWLDIRGNHDNFNIRTINSEENYFRKYSVQGAYNPKSYVHIENRNGVNIAFLGVDACPDPGLRRPFNFVGLLNKDEQQHILSLQAEAAIKADHIVWFGHYPTSCILSLDNDSEKIDIRDVIGKDLKSQVYVCGHLHAMGGLVREMYTRQRKGFLELELEDWKDNRMYRLAAIDHGIFSFVDQKHNVWPVILVTNPKHAQFFITAPEDVLERKLEIEHPFSIDGTGVSFKTMPRILLMLDAPAVVSVKCLMYANHQVILAPWACELQEMVTKMNDSVKKRGIKLNHQD